MMKLYCLKGLVPDKARRSRTSRVSYQLQGGIGVQRAQALQQGAAASPLCKLETGEVISLSTASTTYI